jgi:hypothetical protein
LAILVLAKILWKLDNLFLLLSIWKLWEFEFFFVTQKIILILRSAHRLIGLINIVKNDFASHNVCPGIDGFSLNIFIPVILKLCRETLGCCQENLMCRESSLNFPLQSVKNFLSNCQKFPFQTVKISFPNCRRLKWWQSINTKNSFSHHKSHDTSSHTKNDQNESDSFWWQYFVKFFSAIFLTTCK